MATKEYEIMSEEELNYWFHKHLHFLKQDTFYREAIKLKKFYI